VHGPEYPAEVTRARKPPPGPDSRDRAVGQRWIGEILAAVLQPPLPDPARDSQALIMEEQVQGAQGNVMGSGDHGR
jgi:hypothetical protein